MKLSISQAWEESRAFIVREQALLVPVALLLVGVPLACLFLLMPEQLRGVSPDERAALPPIPPEQAIGMIVSAIAVMGGSLGLYALALRPGISVGEAIVSGWRRLPIALGATLLLAFAMSLPLLALAFLSPAAAVIGVMALALFVSVRTMLLSPVIMDGKMGPLDALRRSWQVTRGQFARLAVFLFAVSVPIMLAQIVAQLIFGLLGHVIGGPDLAKPLADIGVALTMALGQILVVVMVARLYRQVRG